MQHFLVLLFMAIAVVFFGSGAKAQSFGDLRFNAQAADKLVTRAARDGVVRLIVMVGNPAEIRSIDTAATALDPDNVVNLVAQSQDKAIANTGTGVINFNDLVKFKYTPAMAITVRASQFREVLASASFTAVYEDYIVRPNLRTSLPLIGGVSLETTGATGKGQVVAILDSGVASNHPFLKDKVIGEACFGTKQKGPVEIVPFCPGGKTKSFGPGSGQSCNVERCGHGTHVAGIVAGKGVSFSGVSPDAKLLSVQVFSKSLNDPACDGPCLSGKLSDVIRGIEWVFEQRNAFKIAAVNMSLGFGSFTEFCDSVSPPIASAINLLRKANIAPVISSGNNSFATGISLPACLEGAVSVGASTYNDTVAEFSNSAKFLSLLAPGMSLPAAQKGGIYSSVPGGQFVHMRGTSMAAPHVAGAFAVLRSVNPTATVDQILIALQKTGKQITDTRNGVTVPRIQVDRAVAAITTKSPHRIDSIYVGPSGRPQHTSPEKPTGSIGGIRLN